MIKSKNFFSPLRQILKNRNITTKELANALGRSTSYVSQKIINVDNDSFTYFEAYRILEFLGLPESSFTSIFPSLKTIEENWKNNPYL